MGSRGGVLPNRTLLRGRRDRGVSPQEERSQEDQGEDSHLHSDERPQEGLAPPHLTSTPASRALGGVIPPLTFTQSLPRPWRCAAVPWFPEESSLMPSQAPKCVGHAGLFLPVMDTDLEAPSVPRY